MSERVRLCSLHTKAGPRDHTEFPEAWQQVLSLTSTHSPWTLPPGNAWVQGGTDFCHPWELPGLIWVLYSFKWQNLCQTSLSPTELLVQSRSQAKLDPRISSLSFSLYKHCLYSPGSLGFHGVHCSSQSMVLEKGEANTKSNQRRWLVQLGLGAHS
jgi:hypothetical protein